MCFRPPSFDEMMKKCPNCGAFNPPENDKCKKCGTELPAAERAVSERAARASRKGSCRSLRNPDPPFGRGDRTDTGMRDAWFEEAANPK